MRHFIVVSVLVLIGTVLTVALLTGLHILPPQASQQAMLVDQLLGLQVYVIAFLFALIVVLVLYSVVVFRRRPGDDSDGKYITGNAKLEVFWTAVPLMTVIFFATLGSIYLQNMTKSAPNELVVDVVGQQFSWTFTYADAGVSSPELVLPENQAVLFRITSRDVIHSFWVPEFRVKQDAVPDRTTTLRITTSELGDYKVRCAEMCGYAHSYMEAPVRVVSQSEFQTWLAQQAGASATPGPGASPADRGKAIATQQGCLGCHSTDGSVKVAPTWKGLYGSQTTLANGSAVKVDDAYIKESIVDPSAKIVKGFSDIMPHQYANLPQADIDALIAYIKSLSQ